MRRTGLRFCFAASWLLIMGTVLFAADKTVAPGTWGGEHAVLTVTAQGATLELDCANAAIDRPLW